jgi:hypothetical protein
MDAERNKKFPERAEHFDRRISHDYETFTREEFYAGNEYELLVFTEIATHHITRHNTPIHNILSTAPQLSVSQKALGALPEDRNVMPKHVGATIHN